MFRFDLTTVRTTPLTKLVWPTCEDVGGLRVLGSAPTWILDVVADATDDDPSPRRYLFCELSDVLEIGLGQPWVFRELHLLTAVQAVQSSGSALLLVNAIWVCEAALAVAASRSSVQPALAISMMPVISCFISADGCASSGRCRLRLRFPASHAAEHSR